ncbi:hypothetical protein HDV00_011667 [Rhizophlyctis rosea]|nr:hypothetical protein HDV00_011667 [Rhizophlyctis rosea]
MMHHLPPLLTLSPPTPSPLSSSPHHLTSKSPLSNSPRLVPVLHPEEDKVAALAAEGLGMIGVAAKRRGGAFGAAGELKTPRLVLSVVKEEGDGERGREAREFAEGIWREGWFGAPLPVLTTTTPQTPTHPHLHAPTSQTTLYTIELKPPTTHTPPRTFIGLISISIPQPQPHLHALHHQSDHHAILSLYIVKEHRSQGYATEAAKRVLMHTFGVRRVGSSGSLSSQGLHHFATTTQQHQRTPSPQGPQLMTERVSLATSSDVCPAGERVAEKLGMRECKELGFAEAWVCGGGEGCGRGGAGTTGVGVGDVKYWEISREEFSELWVGDE